MISIVNEFLDDLRGGRMTEAPIVRVEQGQLQGKVVTGATGKSFYSFQGIPYAKPPLGSLRFKAPQPPEPWEGIRDATSEGNVCAQIDPIFAKQYLGDENCLFLNIYTPNFDGAFLPVMIYIHGGGFNFGSGNSNMHGGDYLVEKDVVLVTLNYRCGPLGFLCLNTPEVPGNAGIKDMVQAIRWVKENIHNFGGNSGNLTIFGESAGGAAVSVLTASPLTKNIISKAIIQSGTALCNFAIQKNPIENARKLVQTLGSDAEDVDEILEFLTATPVRDLVEAHEKSNHIELFFENGLLTSGMVVEKEFPGVESVLNESFIDLLTSGRVAETPVMIGTTTLEFAYKRKSDDLQIFIPSELNIERNSQESLAIAEKIKNLYFRGNHTSVESLEDYYNLLSDSLINVDTHRHVKYLVQATNRPIYYYKFDYVGELNTSSKIVLHVGLKKAMHGDELGYLFKNDLQQDTEPTSQDIKMRERMLRLWTNFAKTGNPTPDENHFLTVTWLPVTKDNLYYLNLGAELSLGSNPDKEKMEFWDELYSKHYRIWEHPKTNTAEAPRKIQEPQVIETVIETTILTEVIASDVTEARESPEINEAAPEVSEATPEVSDIVPDVCAASPNDSEVAQVTNEVVPEAHDVAVEEKEASEAPESQEVRVINHVITSHVNGNGIERKPRPSNEIKMVQNSNGAPKDVIRANDPPEDDLPKNIGVNKFVNFFESLGGKK